MCAVKGPKCLRPLEHWDHGFESHARHGYKSTYFSVFVLSCVGSGLCDGMNLRPMNPTSWSVSFRLILDGNRPESLIRQW
jgi:hypothetical protein